MIKYHPLTRLLKNYMGCGKYQKDCDKIIRSYIGVISYTKNGTNAQVIPMRMS